MKLKVYAIVALAVLVTVSATASIAREYFEEEKVPASAVKVKKVETAKAEEKTCEAKYEYPVSPQERKRAAAIFYWKPAGAEKSRFDGRQVGEPRYKGTAPAARSFGEVIYVSDYPCKRCVLNSAGKYEYRTNRSN